MSPVNAARFERHGATARVDAGGEHREIGGVQLDIALAGADRVKRVVYPPGFRWSARMTAIVGSDVCKHPPRSRPSPYQYSDGCILEFAAPQFVAIEPGHNAVGRERASHTD